MVENPQELLALHQLGLISFFFPPSWNGWKFFRKSALLLVWWERIIAEARVAKAGSLYKIPNLWTADGPLGSIKPPSFELLPDRKSDLAAKDESKARRGGQRGRKPGAPKEAIMDDLFSLDPSAE
jgi:hypothetical protein